MKRLFMSLAVVAGVVGAVFAGLHGDSHTLAVIQPFITNWA